MPEALQERVLARHLWQRADGCLELGGIDLNRQRLMAQSPTLGNGGLAFAETEPTRHYLDHSDIGGAFDRWRLNTRNQLMTVPAQGLLLPTRFY